VRAQLPVESFKGVMGEKAVLSGRFRAAAEREGGGRPGMSWALARQRGF
jgi:hypothetical protein